MNNSAYFVGWGTLSLINAGLAQSKGYRGETFKPKDMGNRIRIDIFYIENWTFMFDLKIVALTAYNLIKGDKNAY